MQHLLEHFKDLTLHPKNTKELKGLILQLAVQGKLTAQWRKENPDVESASVLLKRLKAEKAQLIKEKKIKNESPLDILSDNEFASDIPSSWIPTRLGEIGDWGAGATPSRSRSDFYGGDINWFKSGELNNGIIDYNSEETINELAIKNFSLRLNKVGDVLIAMYGATIGKTGILAVEGTTNQAICACTPYSCISNVYLHLLLKSLKDTFINQGEGGAQPNISRVKIRNQIFALPPLEEQKAIVATVNQLFAEVEQLEGVTKKRIQLKEDFVTSGLRRLSTEDTATAWGYLLPHFKTFFTEKSSIKKLRESILQLAVQGKLTRDFRKTHPELCEGTHSAEALLERIKAEKAKLIKDGKIKKEKPIPAITGDEIPYELPEGWVWCRIAEVSYSIVPNRDKPKSFNGDITWLTTRNLKKESNKIHSKSSDNKLSKTELLEYNARLLPSHSVIMSCVGQFGLSAVLDREYSCNQQLHCFVPLGKTNPFYLDSIIKNGKDAYEKMATATTISYINKTKCESLIVSLPPIEEQKAIVQKVNALMALCDRLEKEIETQKTTQEEWMQSCLREVFEG